MGRLRELEARRQRLVARSARQRADIAGGLEPLTRRLGAADRALAALRAHPVIAAAGAGALAFVGPHNARLFPAQTPLRTP